MKNKWSDVIVFLFVAMLLVISGVVSCSRDLSWRDIQIKMAFNQLKRSEGADLRIEAIDLLGQVEAREYTKEVAGYLRDENLHVRISAIKALGNLYAREYAEDIAKFLKDKDACTSAMYALGQLQVRKYAKDIAGFFKDENELIRVEAVRTLGKLEAKEYARDIITLLNDENAIVRNAAEEVLKEWGYDVEKLKEQNRNEK